MGKRFLALYADLLHHPYKAFGVVLFKTVDADNVSFQRNLAFSAESKRHRTPSPRPLP